MKRKNYIKVIMLMIVVIALCALTYFGYEHRSSHLDLAYQTSAEKNPYVRFDMEAYDAILQNYWKPATSSDMAQLFQISLEKALNASSTPILGTSDRTGTANMLLAAFKSATSTSAQEQLALTTLEVALYNLPPTGRDELLSAQQQTTLRQTVANINPSNDLYQNLGLSKGASSQDINQAYTSLQTSLAHATSTAAQAQLAQATYAQEVLINPTDKTVYDQSQIEPTVFSHIIGNTLYLDLDKIAPTTIQEFATALDAASTTPNLSSMIIDLRGNIGGDLTFPQYLLGLFIGDNQYAFDLYHQGNYETQRTVVAQFAELEKYGELAILTDNMTQSTAELTTAVFKGRRLAYVVGATTRGWGSVENTYPLKTIIDPTQTYSLLLVNSLTLRDDNQPIESNGVVPNVNISDKNWKQELSNYFHSSSLIGAIEQTVTQPPLK